MKFKTMNHKNKKMDCGCSAEAKNARRFTNDRNTHNK